MPALALAAFCIVPIPGKQSAETRLDSFKAIGPLRAYVNVEFGDGASKEHYTLCRCGASKNKPFCDGSHWAVGFRDP